MRLVRSTDTEPERLARSILRGMAEIGYRLGPRNVLGKPDLAWIKKRNAIFANGCFLT
jgi:DNA mismatch endonuclease (patch repair protein)